ncbi:MAG: universal stress protein, partial [Selenomonadaceae bacterium]|nr:universal stress protein [Selenomonadaceae bacterium]
MIPRLKLSKQYEKIILEGTPWDLIARILPYALCLTISYFVGLAVLRVWGDLVFSGKVLEFLLIEIFMALTIGMLSIFMGWTAANPGIASSRMILFIPGGFIFGGVTSPLSHLSHWVVDLAHIFPLTWQFHFTRDIIQRGASLSSISSEIGAFMIYMGVVATILSLRFYKSRAELAPAKVEVAEPEPLQEKKIQHVLVPTDGSGQAFKAVLKAIQVAEFYEARITLLMCVELEKEISAFEQVSLSGYVPAELNAAAYDFLSELMLVVPSDIKVKTRVEIGEPGETIINFAKYEHCDIIIMGEKGFGGFGKKEIGSVARYVKENATCNVVLVEGLPDDWKDEDNLDFIGK